MCNQETICAIATPPGGALGIIRVSGSRAIESADRIFSPAGHDRRPLSERDVYSIAFGKITDAAGTTIDEVLVSIFRAPHSYTGEDSIEISCHGSRYIMQQILQLLAINGCRQAEPGEYTRRAYMNGKLDLSQAEAVADLIASHNRASHKMAISQLKGHFSNELSELRSQLLKLTSLLELELDFSDHEELEFADRTELRTLAEHIHRRIDTLAKSFHTGQALKKGTPVAIIGKTNVGKSTLLNALLGDERAIVSDVHGTTRDVIEDTIDIDGITFRFIDTAGLRKTTDTVERIGIERTYKKLNEASIIIWLTDTEPTTEERRLMEQNTEGKKLIEVRNKVDDPRQTLDIDTPQDRHFPTRPLQISAKLGYGLDALKRAITTAADIPAISENDVIVTSARHYEALIQASTNLDNVLTGLDNNLSGDLLAEDLRLVLHSLAEITGGEIVTNEVLGNIFKHFCVGK